MLEKPRTTSKPAEAVSGRTELLARQRTALWGGPLICAYLLVALGLDADAQLDPVALAILSLESDVPIGTLRQVVVGFYLVFAALVAGAGFAAWRKRSLLAVGVLIAAAACFAAGDTASFLGGQGAWWWIMLDLGAIAVSLQTWDAINTLKREVVSQPGGSPPLEGEPSSDLGIRIAKGMFGRAFWLTGLAVMIFIAGAGFYFWNKAFPPSAVAEQSAPEAAQAVAPETAAAALASSPLPRPMTAGRETIGGFAVAVVEGPLGSPQLTVDGVALIDDESASSLDVKVIGEHYLLVAKVGGGMCPAIYQVVTLSRPSPMVSADLGSCSDQASAELLPDGALQVSTPAYGEAAAESVVIRGGRIVEGGQ